MMIKILLAGDGGQGIQLIADILALTSFKKGLFVSELPNYGLEQRGGVSLSFIQISDQAIVYPKFSIPDVILIMSEQARNRTLDFQNKCNNIIDFASYKNKLLENNINLKSHNIFFLSMLANILEQKKCLSKTELFSVLQEKLITKPNWIENEKAFNVI